MGAVRFAGAPTEVVALFSPICWERDHLRLLDQTRLPHHEVWLTCTTPQQVAQAIQRLAVRGAPAIGVAAAYGLALGAQHAADATLKQTLTQAADLLEQTRPTAVNLRWAIAQGCQVFEHTHPLGSQATFQALLALAHRLKRQDVEANRRMGQFGAALIADGDRVLTHCNAGALATAGYGTALGVIRAAWECGKQLQVWVDETRPLLQGARLTAWELAQLGIPFRLISDTTAGAIMARGEVDRIVVGADRIAANGDVANKIGTYSLAVLAQRHGIPFYVAAPTSTIDPRCPSGADIPIEERDGSEVTSILGQPAAPAGTAALNLAFDVTPHDLVTAIITEIGVLKAPYAHSISHALQSASAQR